LELCQRSALTGVKSFKQTDAAQNPGGLRSWSVCATKRVVGLANYQEVRDNQNSKE